MPESPAASDILPTVSAAPVPPTPAPLLTLVSPSSPAASAPALGSETWTPLRAHLHRFFNTEVSNCLRAFQYDWVESLSAEMASDLVASGSTAAANRDRSPASYSNGIRYAPFLRGFIGVPPPTGSFIDPSTRELTLVQGSGTAVLSPRYRSTW
ncbi:hypothetical protein J6590_035801 [Homalodisca vitripennis]|nr:hypothetical protein J6590_035801 [Homalodisca vitripennis]